MRLGSHSEHLERLLGATELERISMGMRDWYGPPIPVAGAGQVLAYPGGDFRGPALRTQMASAKDEAEAVVRRWARKQMSQVNAGFASLADIIQELANGKGVEFVFNKASGTRVQFVTFTTWRVGGTPAAGAAAGTAGTGVAVTKATAGAMPYANPSTSGDTLHILEAVYLHTTNGSVLLYDRLWHALKTMNSTANETIDTANLPTRYQNTTANAADSIAGNFVFLEVGGTALAAVAHNWDGQYTNQAGSTVIAMQQMVGNSSAIVDRLDHPLVSWFWPLASGDTGIKNLTRITCSGLVTTGVINIVVGHPLMWMPAPIALMTTVRDGMKRLARIFDNAALAMLDFNASSTASATISGEITACAG